MIDWIKNLKVGDEVIVETPVGLFLERVNAIKDTVIIVDYSTYDKRTGKEIPRGFYDKRTGRDLPSEFYVPRYLREPREELVAEIKLKSARQRLQKAMDSLNVDYLSMGDINKVMEVLYNVSKFE